MNAIAGCFGTLALGVFLGGAAAADTPKPTQAEARAKIEAQTLELARAKCQKKGMVALAEHVKGALMIKCVSPDDPEYKAQQSAKLAQ